MNLLINTDARQIPLADGSVNCIVTSPPYYGLRDYGTARWEGGNPNCDHKISDRFSNKSGLRDNSNPKTIQENIGKGTYYKDVCAKCGAVRIDSQIGLEQTPQEYVDNIVQVFRECRRILRDDGTVWLNLGDSYAGSGKGRNADGTAGSSGIINKGNMGTQVGILYKVNDIDGLKPKDLIGIPWMVAFALRADGWWLRQDIIWHKPNPMPESVKDRCTKAHEYVFLLTKSARYYFDNEAIKEPVSNMGKPRAFSKTGNKDRNDVGRIYNPSETRNKRSVWTVTTKPYKGAHFATYPPELIEPCILAGCPELICSKCGAPWKRDLEREDKRHWTERNEYSTDGKYECEYLKTGKPNQAGRRDGAPNYKSPTFIDHGLKPTCDCGAEPISGIVFDPFVGSGTTVAVANSLGRRGIGIDLNYNYLQLAQERISNVQLPLVEKDEKRYDN